MRQSSSRAGRTAHIVLKALLWFVAVGGAVPVIVGLLRHNWRSVPPVPVVQSSVVDVDWTKPREVEVLDVSPGASASLVAQDEIHFGEGHFVVTCSTSLCDDRAVRVDRGTATIVRGHVTVHYKAGQTIPAPLPRTPDAPRDTTDQSTKCHIELRSGSAVKPCEWYG